MLCALTFQGKSKKRKEVIEYEATQPDTLH
jgi:hypothetical protein